MRRLHWAIGGDERNPTGLVGQAVTANAKRPAPVRGRELSALRACALHPLGLRRGAYPTSMPVLVARRLVKELPVQSQGRQPKETGWFLTEAGRNLLGSLESRNPNDLG